MVRGSSFGPSRRNHLSAVLGIQESAHPGASVVTHLAPGSCQGQQEAQEGGRPGAQDQDEVISSAKLHFSTKRL